MLDSVFTVTVISVILFYMILVGATTIMFSYYSIRGYTVTTIIPCIGTTWYKIYTGIIMGTCGRDSYGILYRDAKDSVWRIHKRPGSNRRLYGLLGGNGCCLPYWLRRPLFGLAGAYQNGYQNETTKPRSSEYVVYNFTGLCFGELKVTQPQRVRVEDIA